MASAKESGVVLWAKNAFKLTSNRASTGLCELNAGYSVTDRDANAVTWESLSSPSLVGDPPG